MFCTKCGKQNDDNTKFCTNCGTPLNNATPAQSQPQVQPQPQPQPQSQPQMQPQPQPRVQPQPQVQPQAQQAAFRSPTPHFNQAQQQFTQPAAVPYAQPAQKSKKKNKKLIGLIAAVVVVVVVGVGAVLATNGFGLLGAPVRATVDEYSWAELSQISDEIANAADDTAALEIAKKYNLTTSSGMLDGSQVKNIQLTNGKTAQVQIVGFRHDDTKDGGKAGITFIFKDAIAEHSMNPTDSNAGGWEGSQMRSWLNNEGMSLLPQELRDEVSEVSKLSNNTGKTENAASVTTTYDKLWLFSPVELCGNVAWETGKTAYYNDVWNAEGVEYKLFRDLQIKSAGANTNLVRSYDGKDGLWWERSATPGSTNNFGCVRADGNPDAATAASSSKSVVPGFCL